MIKRIALLVTAACGIATPRRMLPRRVKPTREETLPLHTQKAVATRGGGDARDVAARALGYCIGAGSTILFAPIVYTLATQKSADGLSLSTFTLSLCGYSCSAAYNYKKGHALSTYVESVLLAVQCAVISFVCALLKGIDVGRVMLGSVAYAGAALLLLLGSPPPRLLAVLQVWATSLLMISLIPQLYLNYSRKEPGQYSPVTAGLSVLGNSIRIFTTLTLTKDPLLLLGFALGLSLNAALLGQILFYT